MTLEERMALDALYGVSFGMAGARHFVVDLHAKPVDFQLTDRQRWNLARLCWRYRRQLPRSISDWALEGSGMEEGPPAAVRGKNPVLGPPAPTKAQRMRQALGRSLQFGDGEQIEAKRKLVDNRRRIA